MQIDPDTPITRREWLTMRALDETGVQIMAVREAVASVVIEHPEWDMDEEKPLREWMAQQVHELVNQCDEEDLRFVHEFLSKLLR